MERMTTKDVTTAEDILKAVMKGFISINFILDFTEHNFFMKSEDLKFL